MVEDFGMQQSVFPQFTGADAMQLPFREGVREFRKGGPQFYDALDLYVATDVQEFFGRLARFSEIGQYRSISDLRCL